MRNMSKKTRKLIDRKVVHKYFWFDYLDGSIFYHSNHVWPARLWIGDAIDHNDDTQCWMYVPAHKEYAQAILIVKKGVPLSPKVSEWINRRRKEFGCKKEDFVRIMLRKIVDFVKEIFWTEPMVSTVNTLKDAMRDLEVA